jgi:tetratricopeptide (TPR) repeat protein
MCRQALEEDPDNPLIYLNVGRIYLAAGYETRAIRAFRKGVTLEPHPLLLRKLGVLVPRRRPIVPFLDRANPVNVITGKLLARF